MIFGKGWPVVKAIDDSFEIEMKYTGILPNWRDKKQIENISPLNGQRSWVNLWNLAGFTLRCYLFNHSDPVTTFLSIQQIETKDVYLRPHKYDNNDELAAWLLDDNDNLLKFHCTKFKPYYLNDINKFDIVDIELKSYEPVTIIPPETLVNPAPNYSGGAYGDDIYNE